MSLSVDAEFIAKVRPLFEPHRYKVMRGGRAAIKSWSAARALLILAGMKALRILCAREYQSSIRDSVHRLLSDQAESLGLSSFYRIEKQGIYGRNGSEFAFTGLSDQTAESLKSYEGFDICWVEEAQVVSERSWQILLPTIRREGSEVWVTFNPEMETDPTWKRFVEQLPEDSFGIELNWRDNPWFSSALQAERERDEKNLPKVEYDWIWEGKCRPTVAGAIYAEEMAKMGEERRIGDFPYDSFHLVHPVFDLGWNDKMSIGFVQRHVSQLRLIDYLEDDHKTLEWYSKELRAKPYQYGTLFLPHDGSHGDYRTGKSARDILEGFGWKVEVLENTPLEDGIRAARMRLAQTFIDRSRCAPLIEHLKRYKRTIPKTTGEPGAPMHDVHSHGADMYRYAALATPMMDDALGLNLPPLKLPDLHPV